VEARPQQETAMHPSNALAIWLDRLAALALAS
jgi:hypothetical protein